MIKEQNITNNIKPLRKDLEVLKQNFPNCFDKNGEFDFEKFKTQLSKNEINFSKESYGMDWLGKSYARLLATDETTTLLKEDETFNQKNENKNSENLLIKGDNLEVLKHLSHAYYEKIKMIYIDPPYNTGSDGFVYADDRKFTVEELQELSGVSEERAKRILNFTQSSSNSHSAWLTFMYPRLYIAKQLLKEDGVIFISIDDNEVAQLRLLMDEVFSEENFFATLTRRSMHTVRNSSKDFNHNADYILVYAKYKPWFESDKKRFIRIVYDKTNNYPHDDNDGKGKYKLDPLTARNYANPYQFTFKNGVVWEASNGRYPAYSIETLKSKESKGEIIFNGKEPKAKRYLKDVQVGQPPNVILNPDDVGFNSEGTTELRGLLGEGGVFSQPKNTKFVQFLIKLLRDKDALVIDFFAGSGTTADAVMQLNAEDNGNRKFILAQLPELIDPKSNKTAYDFVKNELKVAEPTIFEITKERLIRSAKKIQEENKAKDLSNQDLGFKVFETMPIWEDYHFEAEELHAQNISFFDERKLTSADLKTLLVTWKTYDGILLTESLQEIDLNGYTSYYSKGKLYLMDIGFKTENLKTLLEKIDSDKDFNPTTIIAFGYHFESKNLREISENIKSCANKKSIDIDFITRY